jgi:hypothetical protein
MFNRKLSNVQRIRIVQIVPTRRAHAVLARGGDSGTDWWYADHNRQQDEQECHMPATQIANVVSVNVSRTARGAPCMALRKKT